MYFSAGQVDTMLRHILSPVRWRLFDGQVSLPPPPPPSDAMRVQAGALTPGGMLPAAGPGAPRSALWPAKHLQVQSVLCLMHNLVDFGEV